MSCAICEHGHSPNCPVANEIAALRASNAAMRAALEKLALDWHGQGYICLCGLDSQRTIERNNDPHVPRHDQDCPLFAREALAK